MERPAVVGFLLIITGFVLYFSEKKLEANKDKKEEINKRTAILMSIAQGIAALPGFSRSGLTIATGLFSGANRMAAARYSFLLSAPIILGASIVYPLKETTEACVWEAGR
jgi:undecaprenyl-diphosphatase